MLELLSKIVNFISGGVFGHVLVQINNLKKEDLQNHVDEESQSEINDKNENIYSSFEGVVTSYFNNRGLINNEIYFTQNVVLGNEQPKVGDNVSVEATRLHSDGGWIAKRVQILNLWGSVFDDNANKPEKELYVGSVTSVDNNKVTLFVNSEFYLTPRKFKIGYKPFIGDWVQIEVWRQSIESNFLISDENVICVSPLREKRVHGTVTELLRGYGFINETLYFSFSVCERGVYLNIGDSVVADIIESKQRRDEWRATYVSRKVTVKKNIEKNENLTNIDNKPISDISISDDLNFGSIQLNCKRSIEISISNTGKEARIFSNIEQFKKVQGFFCNLSQNKSDSALQPVQTILPEERKLLNVEFTPQNLGKVEIFLVFHFVGFDVSHTIGANVVDQLEEGLKCKTPFVNQPTFFGKKINTRSSKSTLVPGQKPLRKTKIFLPNKLAQYPIPSYIKDCVLNSSGNLEKLIPEISQPLHISNYRKKFSSLLYIEEIHKDEEMKEFDLEMVILRPAGEYLSLNVPGLAEGRPSLLLGDRVIVFFHSKGQQSPSYEGYIHQVRAEDVLLKFSEEFHNMYCNDDLDVEFYFNRTPLRRFHQAIEFAIHLGEEVLFPVNVEKKYPLVDFSKTAFKPFNKTLNKRQIDAVQRIVAGCGRPLPYILFGPPGTGKSVTVVESVLQIFTKIKHSRILVCAPSNSAADLIVERLHNSGVLNKSDMVRLCAFQRSMLNLPECIVQYYVNDSDNISYAIRLRIIVTTCSMAGFLYSFNLKSGHFTHIFVDEAGQATEPECLVPVGFAAGCDESQIVLAGDPFQLGAVLRSDVANEYGLGISYLERLTFLKLYERNEKDYFDVGGYNPLVITKLVNNYRSHASLLRLSSNIFYNRELIPCADERKVNKFVGAFFLPNKEVPFVFHGVRGEDFREGNSPSYFNPAEAVQVLKYVQIIMGEQCLQQDDIGIITPYKKQVEKIRALLDQFDLNDIKVGSVEEFQGQERECIIISTVRSKEDLVDFDIRHNIGFLSNPKRFNVAITRSQSLLIIVGNPIVLCYDAHWCAMLQYAVINSCYCGVDLPSLQNSLIQENFKQAALLLGIESKRPLSSNLSNEVTVSSSNISNENEVLSSDSYKPNVSFGCSIEPILKKPIYVEPKFEKLNDSINSEIQESGIQLHEFSPGKRSNALLQSIKKKSC
ncbi:uncharacterized protein LOC100201712 isoform X1 [Hydra vulgaris]|uniref:uncharacterized protein LOC100201712 isoform X1 n=1 Tax=Hydra vulgaris TaxID=6087 RepID=UPI001F5FD6CB|nr:probable RNA helicase SDE3 [Hydra vulgaris]